MFGNEAREQMEKQAAHKAAIGGAALGQQRDQHTAGDNGRNSALTSGPSTIGSAVSRLANAITRLRLLNEYLGSLGDHLRGVGPAPQEGTDSMKGEPGSVGQLHALVDLLEMVTTECQMKAGRIDNALGERVG